MKQYNTTNSADDAQAGRDEDALFAAWSDDRQSADPQALRAWTNRYPQHADTLIGWAADMPFLECALESAAPDPTGEAQTLAIGRQALAEMRARYFAAETVAAPQSAQVNAINDLIQTAKANGLTAKTLASRLNIGLPLVAKLNQRLVRAATIPEELMQRLANELQTGVEQVRAYLARPATLSAAAQYKSDGVPQVAAPEDFAHAVSACIDMTPEQKRFWLDQE